MNECTASMRVLADGGTQPFMHGAAMVRLDAHVPIGAERASQHTIFRLGKLPRVNACEVHSLLPARSLEGRVELLSRRDARCKRNIALARRGRHGEHNWQHGMAAATAAFCHVLADARNVRRGEGVVVVALPLCRVATAVDLTI